MGHSSLSEGFKDVLRYGAEQLRGSARRIFMAKTVQELGRGGQRLAARELGWNRDTIRKGAHELHSGLACVDAFTLRGRHTSEVQLPQLLTDIQSIVDPESQVDPSFQTTRLYTRLTAQAVRQQLIEQKQYPADELPTVRTLNTKLNALDYGLRRVAKSEPLKRIPETDAIFKQVFQINRAVSAQPGVLRVSWDAKAAVKIGPFSRGGLSRQPVCGLDHDFAALAVITPFNILLPEYAEMFMSLTTSKITSDFIIDRLEAIWPLLQERFQPSWLVINADNGPENHSHRTQFIKRMVDFVQQQQVSVRLAYYPPYHSKYNPVERVWAALEKHWNGAILESVETALNFARTLTWKGKHPVVHWVSQVYATGVKLSKQMMAAYESRLKRLPGLERWFVDIPACPI
jgi:transposase